MKPANVLLPILISLVLSACGGSSGSDAEPPQPSETNDSSSDSTQEEADSTASEETPEPSEPTAPPKPSEPVVSFSAPSLLSANNAYWFSIFDIDTDGASDIIAPTMEGDQWTGYTYSVTAFSNLDGHGFNRATIADLEYGASWISLFEVPNKNSIGFFIPTGADCSIAYYQSNETDGFDGFASVPSISCGNRYVLGKDLNNDQVIDSISNAGHINIASNDGEFTTSHDLIGLTSGAALAISDLDKDGAGDAVTFDGDRTLAVFMGIGDGSFETANLYLAPDNGCFTSHGGLVVLRDVNGDENIDAVAADSCNIFSFLGNGDGTFSEPLKAISSSPVWSDYEVADINSDGVYDLILAEANQETSVTIYTGKGDGTFEHAAQVDTGAPDAMQVGAADLNNDGLLDVIASHGYHNTIGIALQTDSDSGL
ncbi:FG-GAP repeat domain-containing protein [Marinobacter profundi]|uniref:VCBS repeat-containing protein n=1 Tax=Marinobacter profundi TaxID=2666256 RepID=A0A2G1UMM4_9GAMM|nr:VCBS repeat-containing protein [Marinobacter profundi]PHQ15728.1 hypothetical protein CLH61_06130 [Marinobacter profundi]